MLLIEDLSESEALFEWMSLPLVDKDKNFGSFLSPTVRRNYISAKE